MAKFQLRRAMTSAAGGLIPNGSIVEIGDRRPDWFMTPVDDDAVPPNVPVHLLFEPVEVS